MSFRILWIRIAGVLCAAGLLSSGASTECVAQDLATLNSTPLLEVHQTHRELQTFLRSRIAPLPVSHDGDEWKVQAAAVRNSVLQNVVYRGEAAKWKDLPVHVQLLETIEGGPGYHIQKLRLEVLPDLWIPALLYVPEKLSGKVPVFLNVNGHDANGKAADYKQSRCIHMARNGIIALNLEWFGMGQLALPGFAHGRMNQLDLCGTSGLSPFILSMSRAIDFLVSLENADPSRVGVAGLSGGGWQTILISSIDLRVTLCNPVAGYSSYLTRIDNPSDLGDSEQTPVDLGMTADYSTLTAMLAPRAALLTYNEKDNCCFASGHALPPLLAAAEPVYATLGAPERLRSHINHDPGTHNFLLDNRQALYRMIRDQWFGGDESRFATIERPLDNEIRTKEQLSVSLPEGNLDFQKVALSLASQAKAERESRGRVPRDTKLKEIAQTIRLPEYKVSEKMVAEDRIGDLTVRRWTLKLNADLTVPLVEYAPKETKGAVVLFSDKGRAASTEEILSLVNEGRHVFAVDLFYHGECAIPERAYLWALLVSTAGERPLGLQVGQLNAVIDFAVKQAHQAVELHPIGEVSCLTALMSGALKNEWISWIKETGGLETLEKVITENYSFEQFPELFCFGLLQVTDIEELRRLNMKD
ncbi:MAG: hypothetical protein U0996_02510 [Planctomycetaceae bacterium]